MLPRVGLLATLTAYAWLAMGYATATSPWNNPDEPAHFNYVRQVARAGTLPVIAPGDWDQAQLERQVSAGFATGESIDAIRYESWQPPLYYLLAAQVYRAAPADSPLAQIRALRTFDVLLGAATLVVAYVLARELLVGRLGESGTLSIPLAGELLAVAAAAATAGVPMFTAMSAAINNDALANLLGGILTLLIARAAVRPPSPRGAAWLGALLGLAILTKLTLAPFVGLALAATFYAAYRARQPWRQALVSAGVLLALMLLVLAPWLVRQGLTYGWDDLLAKRRHDEVVVGQPRFPGFSWAYAWYWVTTTFHSFWAQFGWMGILATDRLYWTWGVATLGAAAGLVALAARAIRRFADVRSLDPRPLTLALAFAGVLAVDLYHNLTFDQPQGRFLFAALPALSALFVLGWSALLPAAGRVAGVLAVSAGLVALNAYTLLRILAPAFP